MKKRVFFVLALAILVAGGVFAQEASNTGLDIPLIGTFNLGYGFQLNLMDAGGASSSGAVITDIPIFAGFMNTLFGLWSWLNKDYLGGGITAGTMVGGILVAALSGPVMSVNNEIGMGMALGGMGLFLGGMIYGYIRGSGQAKMMRAGGHAQAINDNPLNHLSLMVLPASDGKSLMGNITYSVSF
ncbi:hypothetical protein [Treponema sp. R80B11-R83G3]